MPIQPICTPAGTKLQQNQTGTKAESKAWFLLSKFFQLSAAEAMLSLFISLLLSARELESQINDIRKMVLRLILYRLKTLFMMTLYMTPACSLGEK